MNSYLSLLISLLILFVFSCSSDYSALNETEKPIIRSLTAAEKELVNTSQNFGLKLFKAINQVDTSENIFISPLSVNLALGMTLNGASGQTYNDMKSTLELNGMTEQEINEAYKTLIDLLLNLDEKVIFEIANSIWIREGFPVFQPFIDVNKNYFYSEAKTLNFSSPVAVDIINAWISGKTHGKIEDMLDYIPTTAVMYLINAIYFKGTWTYQFDQENTSAASFYTTSETSSECQMMEITGSWLYYQDDVVQIADMPYGDSLYSMTVMLPSSGQTVDDFISQLSVEGWTDYFDALEYAYGTIAMPKLKLNYKKTINDVLISLGMGIAFGSGSDFTRIMTQPELYISRVIHQSFLQVDEGGTEAAAATIVELNYKSGSPQGFYMSIDHPYLFVIRERVNNTILFIGKISKPVWED